MEPLTGTTRPRNVDWKRAAALLYGDWGTSKAYVPGIAFAIALYSSFWFVLAVSVLTALVGINYIWVCKYFPEGGGVYSSAKAQHRYLALLGGFLLLADYIVTASLSCYDAFLYLGFSFEDAKRWAILAIFIIGTINFFGPRHSGSIAVVLALATVSVLGVLAVACIPQIPAAIAHLRVPQRDPLHWWAAFVGVILALSGVEAVANMTGLMKLDPGSTHAKPRVGITSRKAIVPVMLEVCVLTTLFGLAMHAIPGMGANDHAGDMLRFLAEKFVDEPLKQVSGLSWLGERHLFSWTVGLVIACLLLSAVNTAIVGLVSVQYMMSKDDELPRPFAMLNRFGVPWIVLLISMLAPILVIDIQTGEHALHGLAEMYAIGVVGAITVNLGSTSFNPKLPMLRHERWVMRLSFFVLAAVEITIAVTKPKALAFAVVVVGLGFLARAMHKGVQVRAWLARVAQSLSDWRRAHGLEVPAALSRLRHTLFPEAAAHRALRQAGRLDEAALARQLGAERPIGAIMVAARGVTPTLRFAVEQARVYRAQLFVLFVREQQTNIPVPLIESEDEEAQAVFQAVRFIAGDVEVVTIYAVSDDTAWTILDNAAIAGADMLILGQSRRGALTRMLRGNLLQQLAANLPEEIRLVIVS
jgi:amino acid transporter/nucleotide-binding universal stress UspA family protein